MQYNSRFGWHLCAEGRKAGYRPIAFYKKDFITQGIFVKLHRLSCACGPWLKLKMNFAPLSRRSVCGGGLHLVTITHLKTDIFFFVLEGSGGTKILIIVAATFFWAVDLDNLAQSSAWERDKWFQGPGYAECVMSIFVFFFFFFKKIPVITVCKTIRMNIYAARYEIFIKPV